MEALVVKPFHDCQDAAALGLQERREGGPLGLPQRVARQVAAARRGEARPTGVPPVPARLTPGEVSGEILDVSLPARPVADDLVGGQAPFLDHQDGLAAFGGQPGLDDRLVRLARAHRQQLAAAATVTQASTRPGQPPQLLVNRAWSTTCARRVAASAIQRSEAARIGERRYTGSSMPVS